LGGGRKKKGRKMTPGKRKVGSLGRSKVGGHFKGTICHKERAPVTSPKLGDKIRGVKGK